MLSNDELSKELMRLEKDMNAGRVKLDKSVFVERHLPNIVNNGNKPTEELQNELILIAGGETKRIDLMDNGKVVLTLPSSVSLGFIPINLNSGLVVATIFLHFSQISLLAIVALKG